MPPLFSPEFPSAFAAAWIANWNARDVEAVLAHFRDDCVFVSPVAQAVVGTSRIEGKPALRAYWVAALEKHPSLHFTLDDFAWDGARRILTVVYTSHTPDRVMAAAETMSFDEQGRQTIGRAYYGAVAAG